MKFGIMLLFGLLLGMSARANVTLNNSYDSLEQFRVTTDNGATVATHNVNPNGSLSIAADGWVKIERKVGGVYDSPIYTESSANLGVNPTVTYNGTSWSGDFWQDMVAGKALVVYQNGNVNWRPSVIVNPILQGLLSAVGVGVLLVLIVVIVAAAFRWLYVEGGKYSK